MDNNIIEIEKVLDGTFSIIYPVTLVKYLLNKQKILTIMRKIEDETFKSTYPPFSLDNSKCSYCENKKDMKVKCRMHTSIDRIMNTMQVIKDPTNGILMYKNEIFKMVALNRVGMIYCPHTKMVPETGPTTASRVKKITPFVFEQEGLKLPDYSCIDYDFKNVENLILKYWFSPEYYLIMDLKTDVGFTLEPIK